MNARLAAGNPAPRHCVVEQRQMEVFAKVPVPENIPRAPELTGPGALETAACGEKADQQLTASHDISIKDTAMKKALYAGLAVAAVMVASNVFAAIPSEVGDLSSKREANNVEKSPTYLVFTCDRPDIRQMVKVILEDALHEKYDIDPRVTGEVDCSSQMVIEYSQLVPTLENMLHANGAQLIKQGNIFRVVSVTRRRPTH